MKYFRELLCALHFAFLPLPTVSVAHEKGNGLDLQSVLWGHIKDSYEWHVTNIGDTPVIIDLPVIVKTSTGWYTGWGSDFEEEALTTGAHKGYRPCKKSSSLFIATMGNYERRIVEILPDGKRSEEH